MAAMSILNQKQLENTRAKLRLLEQAVVQLKQQPSSNAYVDELTLRSLQTQIKELKEEMERYRTHAAAGVDAE